MIPPRQGLRPVDADQIRLTLGVRDTYVGVPHLGRL